MSWHLALFPLLVACGDEDAGADSSTTQPIHTVATHCEDPQPVLDDGGRATGYARCADDSVNRVAALPVQVDLYLADMDTCRLDLSSSCECHASGRCDTSPWDRCVSRSNYFVSWCSCTTLCSDDAACSGACIHPEVKASQYYWPECIRASCLTDDDCPSGECGLAAMDYDGELHLELACRTPDDECRSNEDCRQLDVVGNLCRPWDGGAWQCTRWHPID
jgi:hypothetical protein